MIKTLKQFGALCAIESVVAVTFLVTVALCLHEEEYAGALVAFGIAGGAAGLGVLRYRALTVPHITGVSATAEIKMSKEDFDKLEKWAFPIPAQRTKPAKAKPRKVAKKGKVRK